MLTFFSRDKRKRHRWGFPLPTPLSSMLIIYIHFSKKEINLYLISVNRSLIRTCQPVLDTVFELLCRSCVLKTIYHLCFNMIKGKITCGKISCSFDFGPLGQGTDQREQGYRALHNLMDILYNHFRLTNSPSRETERASLSGNYSDLWGSIVHPPAQQCFP